MTRYSRTIAVVAVLFICSGAMSKDCSECHKLQLTGKDFLRVASGYGPVANRRRRPPELSR